MSAQLYDPASGTWTVTGSLGIQRSDPHATLLPNGKVLVAGGSNSDPLASAELCDPANGAWTATGSSAPARSGHAATSLPNGKVLVAGGNGSSGILAGADSYDVGLGFGSAWQPAISASTLTSGNRLVLVSSLFFLIFFFFFYHEREQHHVYGGQQWQLYRDGDRNPDADAE